MTSSNMSTNKVVCCFCGETVLSEKPVEICIPFEDNSFQGLCSHVSCLQSKLHSSIPTLTEENCTITQHQAYQSMVAFLEAYYQRGKTDELAILISAISPDQNGEPGDPAMFQDWSDAVQKTLVNKAGSK
jgi:hypothetical protein